MATLNKSRAGPVTRTHEGAPARRVGPVQELRRTVMACLLWEDTFYESGVSIADRIRDLVLKNDDSDVCAAAVEAREVQNLRHVPLLLAAELANKRSRLVAGLLPVVIQRADELTEFLAIYWREGKRPIAAQVKKGLAAAFGRFNEYDLAKYNRKKEIQLRDVMRLVHPKPKDESQADLWKRMLADELRTPDTWEVALSSEEGGSKKERWTRLIREKRLGGLATLRNLRNMQEAEVERNVIKDAIAQANYRRVIPFRFVAAAKFAPPYEPDLEHAMLHALAEKAKLDARLVVLVDISSSMHANLSEKSDMNRIDAACALAMILRELASDVRVFSFSDEILEVAPRRGFALAEAIKTSQRHGGTYLGKAVTRVNALGHDILVVITDEQSMDPVPGARQRGYMINPASYEHGVGYGKNWTHIDGWSEGVVRYIMEMELSGEALNHEE